MALLATAARQFTLFPTSNYSDLLPTSATRRKPSKCQSKLCGEMNNVLLVRHPAPFPTESLDGYILRLAEQNGYSTPSAILRLAGMPYQDGLDRIRVGELANLVNRPIAQLEAIAYSLPPPRTARLLRACFKNTSEA